MELENPRSLETRHLNQSKISEAVAWLNGVLAEPTYNISERLTGNDIQFTNEFLTNRIYGEMINHEEILLKKYRLLSHVIFDCYYPPHDGKVFYHYTKLSTLKNILRGELKLRPLLSNANYDEFKTFYRDHDLTGYAVNTDDTGKIMEQVLMEQCFAICFASPDGLTQEKDRTLWTSFADNGAGLRLEFKIDSNHVDFRKLFYKEDNFEKDKLLLNKLNKECLKRYNRMFTIAGLSKMGAFYLPGMYHIENETRFLFKKHTDDYAFDFDDTKGYIMLPFKSKFANIELSKIRIGKNCPVEQVKAIILDSGYLIDNLIEVDK
jgi:hypothetical protein